MIGHIAPGLQECQSSLSMINSQYQVTRWSSDCPENIACALTQRTVSLNDRIAWESMARVEQISTIQSSFSLAVFNISYLLVKILIVEITF